MKRIAFTMLVCVATCNFSFALSNLSNINKQIVVTLGETIMLNPAYDVGVDWDHSVINTPKNEIWSGDANKVISTQIYNTTSDVDAFNTTSTTYITNYGYAKVYYLQTLQTGNYNMVIYVSYQYSSSSIKECWATYNIEVVDVTSISIPNTLSLNVGDNYVFTPIIDDSRANRTITWQSSNASVVSVSGNTITANAVGTAIIYCTASNGVSASCVVTVNPILASSVSLNTYNTELTVGEKHQLTSTVLPTNTTNPTITWSSTNQNVATVDGSGLVTAIASGQCNIIATTMDGSNKIASCSVNVLSDVLYADNVVGVPSGTLVLPIQLKNAAEITGCQFELQLPDGVSVAKDQAGNFIASMSDRAVNQDIMCSKLSNGNYQVIVFSATSAALSGYEGAIAYVTLIVDKAVAEGIYSLGIKSIELTKTIGEAVRHKDMLSTLTITSATVGDTNGDGSVTVTDAVGIVNYILGRAPSVFITKAADVNSDGSITITDAVNVINIILNK